MSVAIEMEALISLDRLPTDIIRRIIEAGSDSATEMRFISRTWNAHAKAYLTKHPKLPSSLERVYISRGVPGANYKGRKIRDEPSLKKDLMHMYAVLPERYSKRIGTGGWLSVHEKHNGNTLEVTRNPEPFPKYDGLPKSTIAALYFIAAAILAGSAYNYFLHGLHVDSYGDMVRTGFILLLLSLAVAYFIYAYWIGNRSARDIRQRERFARFFSSFTHIDSLVLDNFKISEERFWTSGKHHAVGRMLIGVSIHRLEVRDNYLNLRLRRQILWTCHVHNVRDVLITVQDIKFNGFNNFIFELIKLNIIVDIYERNGINISNYFGQTRAWWSTGENYMRGHNVSQRMDTIHDSSFDRAEYPPSIKSHIRFEKMDDNFMIPTQPLKAVPRSRGFYHRWN